MLMQSNLRRLGCPCLTHRRNITLLICSPGNRLVDLCHWPEHATKHGPLVSCAGISFGAMYASSGMILAPMIRSPSNAYAWRRLPIRFKNDRDLVAISQAVRHGVVFKAGISRLIRASEMSD